MIKVSELKNRGFEVINGDEITHQCGEVEIVNVDDAKTLNRTTAVNLLNACITEFAPRPNTGTQPVGDDVVVEVRREGIWSEPNMAKDCAWDHTMYRANNITEWKPCMKWLMEQVEKPVKLSDHPLKDEVISKIKSGEVTISAPTMPVGHCPNMMPPLDLTIKPTFTQADADAGDLPLIGTEILLMVATDVFESVEVVHYYDGLVVVKFLINTGHAAYYTNSWLIKPLPTERDKAIASMKRDSYQSIGEDGEVDYGILFEELYDAGYRKEGE